MRVSILTILFDKNQLIHSLPTIDVSQDAEDVFVRAMRRGERIVMIFSKYWSIGIVVLIILQASTSFTFHVILDGFKNINASNLYAPYTFVYVEKKHF